MTFPEATPFREPVSGRLSIAMHRDDDFGAELTFRLEGLSGRGDAAGRLTGTIHGPDCLRAATISITAPIVPVRAPSHDGALVGRTVLTEPAYWSPELPNLYRLDARMTDAAGTSAAGPSFGGMIGLRRLAARGRSFQLERRRYVLRGIVGAVAADIDQVRETHAAVVADAVAAGPEAESLLADADRKGVFLVVRFPVAAAEVCGSLPSRLVRHPSAAFWVARDPATVAWLSGHRSALGRLGPLIGLEVDGGSPPPRPPTGSDFLVVDLAPEGVPHPAWLAAAPPLPLVASRRAPAGVAARVACDLLQAALAGWAAARSRGVVPWDWAGYVPT